MPQKTISYSVRQTPEVARHIDAIAARNGFATRAKYMTYAALNYGGTDDDAIVAELARISYLLHQIDRAASAKLHLLKPQDVADIGRLTRTALRSIIERNAV